jgi:hypothetical protein
MTGGQSDIDRLGATPVRAYGTRFLVEEDPISEGGIWLNGRKDGVDWADVIAGGGRAYGAISRMAVAEQRVEQGNLDTADVTSSLPVGDYDDPTAVLTGLWGPNQHARGTVFSVNPTDEYFQEVQFRFRHTMRPNWCSGYEIFWRCLKVGGAYTEIVRWNGRVGDFTSLQRFEGPDYGVQDGDEIEATIVANVIKGYVNGAEVISAIDDVFAAGAPGIGFNFGVGNTNVDHGFTSFEVSTYE